MISFFFFFFIFKSKKENLESKEGEKLVTFVSFGNSKQFQGLKLSTMLERERENSD